MQKKSTLVLARKFFQAVQVRRQVLLASLSLAVLTACSGGDTSAGSTGSANPPPPPADNSASLKLLPTTPLYSNKTAGTWLWDTTSVLSNSNKLTTADKTQVNALIQFCKDKQVTEVYLQINRDIPVSKYQYLVSTLNAAMVTIGDTSTPISVQALDGASNWVVAAGEARKNAFLDWVFAYQQMATVAQRFSAIHFDVEPYTAEPWKSDLAAGVLAYQNFVTNTKNRIATKSASLGWNINMVVDIPFWYDERQYNNSYGSGNLAEWVYQNVPIVAIMSYRDTSGPIFDFIKNELAYGVTYNRRTIVGAETSQQEPSYVSFYEEGEAIMRTELNRVVTAISLNSSTAGAQYSFGIHDYTNWKSMPLSPR
ncbi:hypothetical protein ACO0LF_14250 [Undibacterium sp. Di27W]